MLTQVRLYVRGDVIGVGFRAWAKIQAKTAKINGWARNVFNKSDVFGPHGGVEIVLQGPLPAVNDTIDHIRIGSPISRVDDIDIFHETPTEVFSEFTILKSEAYSFDK